MRAILVLALIILAGAARADIPGLPALLDRPELRYLVVGHDEPDLPRQEPQ